MATRDRADERRTIIESRVPAARSLDHRIAPNADGGSIGSGVRSFSQTTSSARSAQKAPTL